jgi:putative endonuclease
MHSYWVYILSSKKDGVLYVGMTNNIARRVYEHKNYLVDGFTQKYKASTLIYVEKYSCVRTALKREHSIKGWKRSWKIELIESSNPEWKDLSENFL